MKLRTALYTWYLAYKPCNLDNSGAAPGAYPHGGVTARNRKGDREEKRAGGGGGGGGKKRGIKNSVKTSDINRPQFPNSKKDKEMVARLMDEAKLEASYEKQNRDSEFRPSDEVVKFLAGEHVKSTDNN